MSTNKYNFLFYTYTSILYLWNYLQNIVRMLPTICESWFTEILYLKIYYLLILYFTWFYTLMVNQEVVSKTDIYKQRSIHLYFYLNIRIPKARYRP